MSAYMEFVIHEYYINKTTRPISPMVGRLTSIPQWRAIKRLQVRALHGSSSIFF
jgi:hypothetical protein